MPKDGGIMTQSQRLAAHLSYAAVIAYEKIEVTWAVFKFEVGGL
jgi:hypothetical protein